MQFDNAFLQRASGNELVDKHWFDLADTVRTVGRLIFHCRIPPWVVMDHGIGCSKGESRAAGLEADQKQLDLARLKLRYRFLAVTRGAGELCVSEAARLKFGFDQRQHAGELREQQYAAALSQQFFQHFHQCHQFR